MTGLRDVLLVKSVNVSVLMHVYEMAFDSSRENMCNWNRAN